MLKILIADDNDMNRFILRTLLDKEYEIVEARDGFEALDILQNPDTQIAAMLLDLVMPNLDGYGVLREIRGLSDNVSRIPVLVTTSCSPDVEIKALRFGANDFIVRPFNPEIIKLRLRNAILLAKRNEIIIPVESHKDELTGLNNLRQFSREAASMIEKERDGYYVLGRLDVENFKYINDQYSMEIGDQVLCRLAGVIYDISKAVGGICCRVRSDNFAVLYPSSAMNDPIYLASMERMSDLGSDLPKITCAIGRYVVSDKSLSIASMLDRAGIALASIKGRYDVHLAYYDESMRENALAMQTVINEAEQALKQKQFEVWLQPQYNHNTGAVVGAEALVRWQHPTKGLIPPNTFVPLFEHNGFIYEMDKFVWEQACKLLRCWIDEGRNPLPMSVNVSRCDILKEDFLKTIIDLVERYKLPVDLLRLEITESAFAEVADQLIVVIQDLVDYGFTVEIDDFGSGYSSLNTLKDVPAQILKLDMRFLKGKTNSTRGGNILESIVRMAKWLGMPVIAEGVETKEQADYLKSIGCFYIQGYFYSKPVEADEYLRLVEESGQEYNMNKLDSVEKFDNNNFWDAESMDTLIFNSYVGGACIFEYKDGKTELLRVNDNFVKEICGKNDFDGLKNLDIKKYIDDENYQIFIDSIEKAVATKSESTTEIVMSGVSGYMTPMYMRTTVRALARTNTTYLMYCAIFNITEQRQAEIAKQRIAKQTETLMQNINAGISAVYFDENNNLQYVFANEVYYRMMGYTREEFHAELADPFAVIFRDDQERTKSRISLFMEKGGKDWFEFRICRRDGKVISVRDDVTLIELEGHDRVLLSSMTDITDMSYIKDQMQAIMDNVQSAICAVRLREDGSINYLFHNAVYDKMLGYTHERFEVSPPCYLSDVVHPDDYEEVLSGPLDADGKRFITEYRMLRSDGSYSWVRCHGTSCYFSGDDERVILTVIVDITEERKREDKLKASITQLKFLNEAAKRFLASGDFNSGITDILKYILRYFGALRSYIFEIDEASETMSNTYEVSAYNGHNEKNYLQDLPLDAFRYWLKTFEENDYLFIDNTDRIGGMRSAEKDVLAITGVKSLLIMPVRIGGKICGIIGVDNPTRNIAFIEQLTSLGDYVAVVLARRNIHNTLEFEQRNMKIFFDEAPGCYVRMRIEANGRPIIEYFNDNYALLLGLTREQFSDLHEKNAMAVIHPDDINICREAVKKALKSDESVELNCRLHRSDDSYIWIVAHIRCSKGMENTSYLNVFLTEPSELEKLKRQRQEILANLPCGAGIYEIKAQGGINIVYLNNRYGELVGRSISDTENVEVMDFIHPHDRELLSNRLKDVSQNGAFIRDMVLRIKYADQSEYKPFRFNCNAVSKEHGNTMVYATFMSLSQVEMAFTEMLPVALQAMMAASTDLSFVKDKNLNYVCCSRIFAHMVGLRDEREIVGKTDYDLFDKELADKYVSDDRKLIAEGKPMVDFVERIPSTDGHEHYSSTSKYLLYDSEGNLQGLYGVGRDITDMREAYARLRLLNDNLPGGIGKYEVEKDCIKVRYRSEGLYRMLGYVQEEQIVKMKKYGADLICENDRQRVLSEIKLAAQEQRILDTTCRVRVEDGSYRWIALRGKCSNVKQDSCTLNTVVFDLTGEKKLQACLDVSAKETRIALAQLGKTVCVYDLESHELTVSHEFTAKHGHERKLTRIPERFTEGETLLDNESVLRLLDFYGRILAGDSTGKVEVHCRNSATDDTWCWERYEFAAVKNDMGKTIKAYIFVEDTTKEHEKEKKNEELKESNRIMKLLTKHSNRHVYCYDVKKKTVFSYLDDGSKGEVYQNVPESILHSGHISQDSVAKYSKLFEVIEAGVPEGRVVLHVMIKEKGARWADVRYSTIFDKSGKAELSVFSMVDITEEHEKTLALENVRKMAELDGLTGVYNKITAETLIRNAMRNQADKQCSLFIIDMDNLKVTNDTLGHPQGDRAIKLLAEILQSHFRCTDIVGRIGGDEFIVFLSNLGDKRKLAEIASNLQNKMKTMMIGENNDTPLSASIGIAVGEAGITSFDELYRNADKALYSIKKDGKQHYAFYQGENA